MRALSEKNSSSGIYACELTLFMSLAVKKRKKEKKKKEV